MKKIVIAMESQIAVQLLQEQLTQMYCVIVCRDAMDTLQVLKEQQPDVLVLDMLLPGMDGVTLLQIARDAGVQAQVIAVSSHITPYLASALEELDVCCLMREGADIGCLAAKVMDVAQWQEAQKTPLQDARRILAILGFKMTTISYQITELAVCLYAQDPGQQVTNQLYPKVASFVGGTVSQVEKAIRSSVESGWKDRNDLVWQMYFATGKNGKVAKPSNAEFLSRIAGCIIQTENSVHKGERKREVI